MSEDEYTMITGIGDCYTTIVLMNRDVVWVHHLAVTASPRTKTLDKFTIQFKLLYTMIILIGDDYITFSCHGYTSWTIELAWTRTL